jgi:putative hydrolase of the HAD superfamily
LTTPRAALIVDFGGPVLLTPFELTLAAEARLNLAPGRLDWAGPFAPERDPEWQDVLAGRLAERSYWARRGEQFGRIAGCAGGTRVLMAALYQGAPHALLRPEALALMHDARAAGLPVGVPPMICAPSTRRSGSTACGSMSWRTWLSTDRWRAS